MNNLHKKQSGFSTLEILIAMAILITAISSVMMVVFSNQTVVLDLDINNSVLTKAKYLIEQAKVNGHQNFNSLTGISTVEEIFNKKLTVRNINPCRSDVQSSISWATNPSRPGQMSIDTTLTDPAEALALRGDCGPEPFYGDWENPSVYGSLALNKINEATDIDEVNIGSIRYAIISARSARTTSDDISIVDLNDKASPVLMSSINTAPSVNSIDVAGNFVFIAAHDNDGQFQVVDISDLARPSLAATKSLPGVDEGGPFPQARKIFYYDSKVYIGTWKTEGPEFHIFDVAIPSSPVSLGSKEVGHNIEDIVVRNELVSGSVRTIAYIADSVSSDSVPEVIVFDVTDPENIVEIGNFNAPGAYSGTALYVIGSRLYFGREKWAGGTEFFILDISVPGSITALGSVPLGLNSGSKVTDIIVSGDFAFISATDSTAGFQVWNIANPAGVFNVSKYNFSGKSAGMDFDGNYVYLADTTNNSLNIIYDQP